MSRPDSNPVFDAVSKRIPLKFGMNLFVGCVYNDTVILRAPKQNVLDDFLKINEAKYGGVIGIDFNHCIYFMDRMGLLNLSEMIPMIVFIPHNDDCIAYLYKEVSTETKTDNDKYSATCESIYAMIQDFVNEHMKDIL